MRVTVLIVITIQILIVASVASALIAAQSVYAVEKINTVDVRARPIHVTLPTGQTVTVFHIFIVYTQKPDKDYVCQGFPFDPVTGQIPKDADLPLNLPSPFLLQGRCIPFGPDNRDFIPNAPSITVISGADAKDTYKCFVKETEKFNDAKLPYALLATNSNSYSRTMLDKCDVPGGDSRLPPPVSVQTAPGWSITGLP